MEIALGLILLVLGQFLMSLTVIILNLGPTIIRFLYFFFLIGIIIFIIAESFKDKYLYKGLQKIIPNNVNAHNNINNIINIALLLIKIPFSIFNYLIFFGLLLLYYQYNYYLFQFLLAVFILTLLVVILFRILHLKKMKIIFNLFFLFEPCLLSYILYFYAYRDNFMF